MSTRELTPTQEELLTAYRRTGGVRVNQETFGFRAALRGDE